MDQLSDSRQAGAEIEVTPAMIEAGAGALRLASVGGDPCDGGREAAHNVILAALSTSTCLRVRE